MGRTRGSLTSKIHAVVDTRGLPILLALTAGEAHDNRLAGKLLSRPKSKTMLLADRGYDADWIRALATERGIWANIPPRCNRTTRSASARISTVPAFGRAVFRQDQTVSSPRHSLPTTCLHPACVHQAMAARLGGRALVRLGAREPDNLAPLLGFVGDEPAEVGGRAR
jgi:transposase